jgi:cell surface protein SprA
VPYATTHSTNINGRANLEPMRDLRLELNMTRNQAQSVSEFFRWNDSLQDFRSESRMETGNFSISFLSFKTAFIAESDFASPLFQQFLDVRSIMSNKLADERESLTGIPVPFDTTGIYREGYGPTNQDVLIASFLAAYSGADPISYKHNLMPKVPLPNWRITYDGLAKLDFFKRFFKSFTVGHAYRSSYNIGSYTTNLFWSDDVGGFTERTDLQGNFLPEFTIAQISITEQFSPLLNLDMTWHNSLLTRIEYKSDRNLAFSLMDGRLQEMKGRELLIGSGYRFKNVPFPFRVGPTRAQIKSDMNLRADLSFRNNVTRMRSAVDNIHQPTGGQNIISIKIAADYILNAKLNLRIFYDQILTSPVITTSFPSSNTNAGFSLRFTLQ